MHTLNECLMTALRKQGIKMKRFTEFFLYLKFMYQTDRFYRQRDAIYREGIHKAARIKREIEARLMAEEEALFDVDYDSTIPSAESQLAIAYLETNLKMMDLTVNYINLTVTGSDEIGEDWVMAAAKKDDELRLTNAVVSARNAGVDVAPYLEPYAWGGLYA